MKRADVIRRLQFAGYHDDRADFTRLYTGNRISFAAASAAFQLGRSAHAAGVSCGCSTCRGRMIAAALLKPQDPTMKLTDYKRWITEIGASDLSANAKAAALDLTARQLDGAAWTGGARDAAARVAMCSTARRASPRRRSARASSVIRGPARAEVRRDPAPDHRRDAAEDGPQSRSAALELVLLVRRRQRRRADADRGGAPAGGRARGIRRCVVIATAEDLHYGRRSSPHAGELRLEPGGSAYPGETVVMYRADCAEPPLVACAVCRGARVVADVSCSVCDGRGEYRDPGTPLHELRRCELARYVVQPGDRWRAPDLCSPYLYYAVIPPSPHDALAAEWARGGDARS